MPPDPRLCSKNCPPYVQRIHRLQSPRSQLTDQRSNGRRVAIPPLLEQDSVYGPWVLLTKKVCRPKSLARINPAGLKSRSRQIWVQYAGNYSQSPQAIRVRRPRTARRLHRLQTGSPNEASRRSLRPSQSRSAHREPQFGLKHSPEVVASHRPSCPCTVSGAPCQQVQTLPGRRETLAPASFPARPCGSASAVIGAFDA